MATCWNCGKKIIGTPIRSWQTTSYSQRSYGGMGLRSGRIYVGASGGQRQSRVNLCALCDIELNPAPIDWAATFTTWWNQIGQPARVALALICVIAMISIAMHLMAAT